jgi:hypothetical protein
VKHLPRRELEPTTKPEDRRSKTPQMRDRIVAAITIPDLFAVVLLFVVACLIAANLIFRFPDLGLTVEQFNPFAGP